jgi:hypothetical protein
MGTQHTNAPDISGAKDADLRASLGALKRASLLARRTAIQTNTHLVIVKDGVSLRIPADELRRQAAGAMLGTAEGRRPEDPQEEPHAATVPVSERCRRMNASPCRESPSSRVEQVERRKDAG